MYHICPAEPNTDSSIWTHWLGIDIYFYAYTF